METVNVRQARPIVLLTDFGETDAFVGILKGVIAGISPSSLVIDLCHGIEPQDIGRGAFVLATSFQYFPRQSIFCVVVDPGVGSRREAVCIETTDYCFVGPDNGILWEAARDNGIRRIVRLAQPAYFLKEVSSTFHGRDIFAPVCAHISAGMADLTRLGPVKQTCEKYQFPEIRSVGNSVDLVVLNVDRFGNMALNLKNETFRQLTTGSSFELKINGFRIRQFYTTYAQASEDELFLVASSCSYMEICLKNGSAAGVIQPVSLNRAVLEVGHCRQRKTGKAGQSHVDFQDE